MKLPKTSGEWTTLIVLVAAAATVAVLLIREARSRFGRRKS